MKINGVLLVSCIFRYWLADITFFIVIMNYHNLVHIIIQVKCGIVHIHDCYHSHMH